MDILETAKVLIVLVKTSDDHLDGVVGPGNEFTLDGIDQLGPTVPVTPPGVAPEILQREKELLVVLQSKEVMLHEAGSNEQQWQLFIKIEETQRELDLTWADLESIVPDYVALRRDIIIPLTQICELLCA